MLYFKNQPPEKAAFLFPTRASRCASHLKTTEPEHIIETITGITIQTTTIAQRNLQEAPMNPKQTLLQMGIALSLLACSNGGTTPPTGTNSKPTINAFTVTPDTGTSITQVKLEWDVTAASKLEISSSSGSNIGTVTPLDKGSSTLSAVTTQTFTLKASNANGETSKTATVTLTGPKFTTVETVAGQVGVRGGADGNGNLASFNYPNGVAVTKAAGSTGNEVIVYITALNESIRYAQVGYAGNPVGTAIGLGSSGSVDGPPATAQVRAPNGIAIGYDSAAYEAFAYWTEDDSCVVRKLTDYPLNGNRKAVTVAGKAYTCGAADGVGGNARFNRPRGIVANTRTGEVFVADSSNRTIRRIYADTVTTVAGLAGASGSTDGAGASARFTAPTGIALDRQENLIVTDYLTIRKITPSGEVSTIAGKAGEPGSKDGTRAEARFKGLDGLAIDEVGNIYVSDLGNQTIRKITPDGTVSTVAGVIGVAGAADGGITSATFNDPHGLAYYNKQLFIADYSNQTIRRIR